MLSKNKNKIRSRNYGGENYDVLLKKISKNAQFYAKNDYMKSFPTEKNNDFKDRNCISNLAKS